MELSVRSNCRPILNWILHCIILFEVKSCANQLSVFLDKRDMNAAIVHIIFVERFICHFFLRLNMWIYREEIARLVNQTSTIDNNWGNIF